MIVDREGSGRNRWPIGVGVIAVAATALLVLAAFLWGPAAGSMAWPYRVLPFVGFWVLVWVFILVVVVRGILGPCAWGGAWTYGSAGVILRERYARGEITREQFEQMRRDLGPDR